MSVSFCLPHPVAVSGFMICRGLCACTGMLWMCVLYVSFGSKVNPEPLGALHGIVLCCLLLGLLDLRSSECDVVSLYVVCLTVFVNCLVKQFAMCLSVVAVLLLNVMDVFSVCGGALLDRPCMVFQRVCLLCL